MRKGIAIAKDNMTYPEYEPRLLWIKGVAYEVTENDGTLSIVSEYDGAFHFTGVAREQLDNCFEFTFEPPKGE